MRRASLGVRLCTNALQTEHVRLCSLQAEAQRFNHEYIGTEHVLLGLVKEGSGVAANVLKSLDVDLRKIRLEVKSLFKADPRW